MLYSKKPRFYSTILLSLFLSLSFLLAPSTALAQSGVTYLLERNPFYPYQGFVTNLMLEEVSPKSTTVTWKFENKVPSHLVFCEGQCNLEDNGDPRVFQTPTGDKSLEQYKQNISGLKPGTLYLFAIASVEHDGAAHIASPIFSFITDQADGTPSSPPVLANPMIPPVPVINIELGQVVPLDRNIVTEVILRSVFRTGGTIAWRLSDSAQGFLLHCMEPCNVLDPLDKGVQSTEQTDFGLFHHATVPASATTKANQSYQFAIATTDGFGNSTLTPAFRFVVSSGKITIPPTTTTTSSTTTTITLPIAGIRKFYFIKASKDRRDGWILRPDLPLKNRLTSNQLGTRQWLDSKCISKIEAHRMNPILVKSYSFIKLHFPHWKEVGGTVGWIESCDKAIKLVENRPEVGLTDSD